MFTSHKRLSFPKFTFPLLYHKVLYVQVPSGPLYVLLEEMTRRYLVCVHVDTLAAAIALTNKVTFISALVGLYHFQHPCNCRYYMLA